MPPKIGKKYSEVLHHDVKFKIGDACVIKADNTALPFIGKILDIYRCGTKEGDIAMKVVWYYRPEEAMGGRKPFHGDRELFDSDHTDEVHKATIMGKCFVHNLRKFESLPQVTDQDFFTRFMYKPAKKQFEPDKVPVYCDCEQPYNPDKPMILCGQCEDWFHPGCLNISEEALRDLNRDTFRCPSCTKQQANKRARTDSGTAAA